MRTRVWDIKHRKGFRKYREFGKTLKFKLSKKVFETISFGNRG